MEKQRESVKSFKIFWEIVEKSCLILKKSTRQW